MTKPVNTVPPLPYPGGRDDNRSLAAFDQDIVKALQIYLGELARRANAGLGIDGTDVMTDDLNMGFNDLINALTLTIVRSAAITDQGITIGPSDATGHFIRGFSVPTNAKNIIYNATTDVANTAPSAGSNRHVFQIRGVDKLTVDDDGSIDVNSGWLKFPATQVPSADVNTFDDYEEGTWTPTLAFGGASTGITYTTQQGTYVKIGKVVHFQFRLIISSKGTATGNVAILGLPFSSDNYHPVTFGYGTNFTGLTGVVTGYMENNSANITLRQSSATGVGPILTDTVFTATTDMIIGGSYIATA